jgi:hypothetical protein
MNNRFRINLPASVEGRLRHFGLRLTIFDRLRPKVSPPRPRAEPIEIYELRRMRWHN